MDSATPRPVSATPCTEPGHTDLVSAWCQTCQTFVCIQGMVSEKHAGHIFISLEKRAGEFGARIEQRKIELRKIEESFGADLVQQLEIETKFNARVDDLNNEIDKRSQRLHSEIESWKTKTKSALQTRVDEIRISMKVRQDQIKEDQNKLRAALDQCSLENYKADEAIQVKRQSSVYIPACLILTEVNSTELDMDTLLGHISDEESYGSDCVSYAKPFSSSGSDDTSDLHGLSETESNFMEELKHERIYCDLPVHLDDVEILKHCQFKNPNQQEEEIKLAASRDGGIWVTCTGQRCIKHFDDEGNCRRKVLTDFDIYDIDVNSKNELFASVHNGFKIKKENLFQLENSCKNRTPCDLWNRHHVCG
ncbi:uncharacterized protein LOC117335947 [Pecten maximus]|uniref:uncharacterized protein LOC117335947 n=1 Tax=Pecten maximus TaxID=6579 RepID=UPI001458CD01|nr:uncharacterized protein LOC117335947 [Pecten maximus]